MDLNILTTILDHTNTEMAKVRVSSEMSVETATIPVFQDTNLTEIRALVGVLIMSGVRKDGHLGLQMMFEVRFGAIFYRSLFSHKRFEWLMRTLRFDNRDERDDTDRFAPIRDIWDRFIANCGRLYNVGPVVTVDEMLAPLRGRVPFRM